MYSWIGVLILYFWSFFKCLLGNSIFFKNCERVGSRKNFFFRIGIWSKVIKLVRNLSVSSHAQKALYFNDSFTGNKKLKNMFHLLTLNIIFENNAYTRRKQCVLPGATFYPKINVIHPPQSFLTPAFVIFQRNTPFETSPHFLFMSIDDTSHRTLFLSKVLACSLFPHTSQHPSSTLLRPVANRFCR